MNAENTKNTVRSRMKKKGGRKRLSPNDRRSEKIFVRLSPVEKKLIESRAEKCGVPVATLAYRAVMHLKITPRITEQEYRDIRSLTGMANNLNQLAHTGNIGVSVKTEVARFLRWVGEIISKYKV